ncbi:MAG: hypothetical protein ACTHJ2_06965, partial [Candidatus Nitrosocosmicus sp.]
KEIQKSFFERREKRLKKYSDLLKTFTKNINIHKQKLISIYYKNKFFFIHNILNTKIEKTETGKDHLENTLNNKGYIRDRFVGLSLNYDYEKIIGFGVIKDFTNSHFIMQSSINKFDHIFLSDIKLSLERNYSYQ